MTDYVPQVGDKVTMVFKVIAVNHETARIESLLRRPSSDRAAGWFPVNEMTLVERPAPPLQVGDVLTVDSPRPPDGTILDGVHPEFIPVKMQPPTRWPLYRGYYPLTVERVGYREADHA